MRAQVLDSIPRGSHEAVTLLESRTSVDAELDNNRAIFVHIGTYIRNTWLWMLLSILLLLLLRLLLLCSFP